MFLDSCSVRLDVSAGYGLEIPWLCRSYFVGYVSLLHESPSLVRVRLLVAPLGELFLALGDFSD